MWFILSKAYFKSSKQRLTVDRNRLCIHMSAAVLPFSFVNLPFFFQRLRTVSNYSKCHMSLLNSSVATLLFSMSIVLLQQPQRLANPYHFLHSQWFWYSPRQLAATITYGFLITGVLAFILIILMILGSKNSSPHSMPLILLNMSRFPLVEIFALRITSLLLPPLFYILLSITRLSLHLIIFICSLRWLFHLCLLLLCCLL